MLARVERALSREPRFEPRSTAEQQENPTESKCFCTALHTRKYQKRKQPAQQEGETSEAGFSQNLVARVFFWFGASGA
jgi:hypothetical protein